MKNIADFNNISDISNFWNDDLQIFSPASPAEKNNKKTSAQEFFHSATLIIPQNTKQLNSYEHTSDYNGGSVDKVYTLDASTMTVVTVNTYSDGAETKAGKSNYFTIVWSSSMKIDSSSKTFSDGYIGTQRISMNGAWANSKQYIKFTTGKKNSKVKVWWVAGGANRHLQVAKKSDKATIIAQSSESSYTKNSMYITEMTLADADTYMLGSSVGGNFIFKIEVTEPGEE